MVCMDEVIRAMVGGTRIANTFREVVVDAVVLAEAMTMRSGLKKCNQKGLRLGTPRPRVVDKSPCRLPIALMEKVGRHFCQQPSVAHLYRSELVTSTEVAETEEDLTLYR